MKDFQILGFLEEHSPPNSGALRLSSLWGFINKPVSWTDWLLWRSSVLLNSEEKKEQTLKAHPWVLKEILQTIREDLILWHHALQGDWVYLNAICLSVSIVSGAGLWHVLLWRLGNGCWLGKKLNQGPVQVKELMGKSYDSGKAFLSSPTLGLRGWSFLLCSDQSLDENCQERRCDLGWGGTFRLRIILGEQLSWEL